MPLPTLFTIGLSSRLRCESTGPHTRGVSRRSPDMPLSAPETFDIIQGVVPALQRRNLAEVCKMLNQISVGRLFDSELPYMVPLNNFIGTSSEKFVRWIYDGEVRSDLCEATISDALTTQSFTYKTPRITSEQTSTSTPPRRDDLSSTYRPTTSMPCTASFQTAWN